jgi:dTDP-4-amino-4,6-dideoxygalactose transaminase
MKISDKYSFYDKSDINIIKKVLKNKQLSGTSKFIDNYEKKLCIFFNSNYAVALSSGTAAIQTALFSLDVKRGDEVIVSSVCPSMSVVPIIALGAKPVFCDTIKGNFGLNIKIQNIGEYLALQNRFTDRVREIAKLQNQELSTHNECAT